MKLSKQSVFWLLLTYTDGKKIFPGNFLLFLWRELPRAVLLMSWWFREPVVTMWHKASTLLLVCLLQVFVLSMTCMSSSHSGYRKLGMIFSFLFPFRKVGNAIFHSRSRSQSQKTIPAHPCGAQLGGDLSKHQGWSFLDTLSFLLFLDTFSLISRPKSV